MNDAYAHFRERFGGNAGAENTVPENGLVSRAHESAEELREIANYFTVSGKELNAAFCNRAANMLEILAGAYSTSTGGAGHE